MKTVLLSFLYRFLAFCARIYIRRHSIYIIAITGSVGKTSCRLIISEVLKQVQESIPGEDTETKEIFRIYTSPENYNSELGLVFSVFGVEKYHPSFVNLFKLSVKIFFQALFGKKNTDILIAEYGIDAPRDMDKLLRVAVPDITVLTKLDAVHSGNFPGGVREYWAEKWKLLLKTPGKVYVNLQDSYSQEQYYLLSDYIEIGDETEKNFDLIKDDEYTVKMKFYYKGKNISLNLIGEDNMVYTKLGLDIATDLGFELTEKGYDFNFKLQAGRFSFFKKGESIYIDSSYNAAPESVKLALKNTFLLQKKIFSDYKIITVLGDMRELGDISEEAHRDIAEHLYKTDAIYTVGPLMYEYLIPELKNIKYKGSITSSLSARDIGKKLKKYLKNNNTEKYLILFKGSQNTIYTEEALAELLIKSEYKKLPRQSKAWKAKKEEFFREV
ncbi:hypothetical protein LAT59_03745 [Candidatus Gracilibacteria bacterium]|nr:hypothetical protein [Candidatus Gracilibacteria bacterium]